MLPMPNQQHMPQQHVGYGGYGAMNPGDPRKVQQMGQRVATVQRWFSCWFVSMNVLVPTLTFAVISCLAFFLDSTTSMVVAVGLLVVICAYTVSSFRRGNWAYIIVGISCVIALIAAFVWGGYIHDSYIKPYEDVTNLNIYPNVNPQLYTGSQLMDAGQINFVKGSHLDLSKSFGFKNGNTYCVAPIVGPAQNASSKATYDFWAVGTNCCSGHKPDYHCGEYNNPLAQKGLRLMRDDERSFFRLAVEEAKAAYNIEANHPVFMYWMQNPSEEVKSYQETGLNQFYLGVVIFGLAQLFITISPALLQLCGALCPSCACCDTGVGDVL